MKDDFKYVMLTVSFKKVKGRVRQYWHVRVVPLETDRFRFGLAMEGKTLDRKAAERYAADVDQYITDWLDGEIERSKQKRGRKK